MNKVMLLMMVATLTACGPSQPSETVDTLVSNPERIKEIQRQCKEDRAKVGDELCVRAAEAAKRRFFGDRPEQKTQQFPSQSHRRNKILAVTSLRHSALALAAFLLLSSL